MNRLVLFHHRDEGYWALARTCNVVSACRILLEALEVEQTEEMKVTAQRALGQCIK